MTSIDRNTFAVKPVSWKILALTLAIVMGSLVLTTAVVAHPVKESGKRHGPPIEALNACQNIDIGDACSFIGRHKDSLTGQCFETRDQQIACKPEGYEPPHHRSAHDSQREHDCESGNDF